MSETVREVCARMIDHADFSIEKFGVDQVNLRRYALNVLSAYEREMSAKDAEISRLKSEIQSKKNRINGLVTDVQHKNGHICDKHFEMFRLEKQVSRLRSALLTICTSDMTAEGLREIAINACNFKEENND